MSGNQKQPAAGGPQTQRYQSSQYQPILTQPPNRSDAYHNPAQNYVQQGQPPNQGPGGLRNIQSSGPPNQASTPPNQDLKVASLPGQLQQMQFVSNQAVRPAQAYFQRGATGAPTQPQRMPNQHRQAPQATPAQIFAAQQSYLMQPVYIQPSVYYNNQRPPNTMMGPQAYPPHQAVFSPSLTYQTFSSSAPSGVQAYTHTLPYMYPSQPAPMISRASVTPVSAAPANTSSGNPQAAPPLAQPSLTHNMYPARNNAKQRRPNAISIIDPNTGVDKLNEIFDSENASQPASGESSARQTPQPAPPNPNKEVQAIFAKQVAQVLSEDRQQQQAAQQAQQQQQLQQQHPQIASPHEQPLSLQDPEHFHPLQPQQPQSLPGVPQSYDIVRSNLQYDAKEFVSVSSTKPTIKESTPIVSANSDAAEVILSKKDRESPVKSSRKQQPKPVETPQINKETECDKISSTVKEEPVPVPQPTLVNPDVSAEVTSPTEVVKESDKKGAKKSLPVEHKSPEPESQSPTVPFGDVASNNGKSKSNRSKTINNQNGKQQQQQPQQQPQQQHQPQQQPQHQPQHQPQQQPQHQPKQPPQQQQLTSQPQPQQVAPQIQPAAAIAVVPTPQPPKANNRSNKFKELNMKGANKEGTDMDAFNDNAAGKTEINANVLPTNDISTENDAANANPVAAAEATVVAPSTETDDKKDSNENVTTTIKTATLFKLSELNLNNLATPATATATVPPVAATKPITKPFDVTSIIKDSAPKSMPPFPINNDNRDETDRASVNDRLVLAKNDVNNKVSNKENTNDNKPQLPYRPGQWAPDKPDGLKVYEKDFLLSLKNLPLSQKKPDCNTLPEGVIPDERSRQMDGRLSMGGGRTDFVNPPFANNYGGKSGSQRGTLTKRPSQSGKMGNRAGDKNNSKPQPKVSISLRGDVKLHESENAWKPARFNKVVGEPMTEQDKRTESLYKKVRSVLNKLTPQKFDTLVNQVRQLQIDNKERLQGVIDLVFEKAIDEPSFSLAYAMMCKEIQTMQVSVGEGEKKNLAFRTLLVTRCQAEFEKQSVDESGRAAKVQEMEECTDADKKKELQFELQESERSLRMRSVGCIRFIGELFKQHMLTASIMRRCLQTLLDNKDEESLECLCKLLTTVGKELESKAVELANIFDEMKRITDGKRQKVSSRIRFMLQDVIDLRNSKWIPRRGDANPKTMDQIQKEAENEHMNIQVMNMNPQRRDDRGGGGGGGGGGPRRGGGGSSQKVNDEGWSNVGPRNSRQQFSIQTDKMRVPKLPMAHEPLGASQQFSNWAKGAAGGAKNPQHPLITSNNVYSALENVDMERRPMNSRSNKDSYSSKGPSMERNLYNKSYDGRGGSRSGSQHRDSNTPMRSTGPPPSSMMPPSMAPPQSHPKSQQSYQQPATTVQPAVPSATPAPPSVPKLSEEQIERRIRNSLDEFINGCCTPSEYFQDVASAIEDYSKVVYESYNYILEKSQTARLKTGELFAKLIKAGSISVEEFAKGFEELLGLWEDLVIDIPQIWQYFAEDLVSLLLEAVLPFPRLQKLLDSLIQVNAAKKLLKPLFALVVKEKGPKFLQTSWQASGMELSSFMPSDDVVPFVQENKLDFLLGGESPVAENSLSFDTIQDRLSVFFKNKSSFDDIVNWISVNVGDCTKEPKFIRALATAIFENSISKSKLQNEVLTSHNKLIQKYVDTHLDLELQCLYALQSLIQKLEHPQGLLLSICDKLYEDSIFSQESFVAWEGSTDASEQEGKGVALKQLTSFFTQLKENEEEDDYSSNSEDA